MPFLAARIDVEIVPSATEMTRPTQWISFGVHADVLVERDNLPLKPSALALARPAHDVVFALFVICFRPTTNRGCLTRWLDDSLLISHVSKSLQIGLIPAQRERRLVPAAGTTTLA